MEFLIEYGYIGVFIASFLAATVLPFSSEVVLTGVLLAGAAYWPCMIAATLGNFLGGMSCYWLGMLGKVEWIEKYLKLDAVKLQKVQDWIKGKGSWMGFFVFLPGIGDFIAPRRQKCDFQYAAFGRNLKEVFEVAIVAELRVFGKFPDNLVFITAYHCPDRAVVGG